MFTGKLPHSHHDTSLSARTASGKTDNLPLLGSVLGVGTLQASLTALSEIAGATFLTLHLDQGSFLPLRTGPVLHRLSGAWAVFIAIASFSEVHISKNRPTLQLCSETRFTQLFPSTQLFPLLHRLWGRSNALHADGIFRLCEGEHLFCNDFPKIPAHTRGQPQWLSEVEGPPIASSSICLQSLYKLSTVR